MRPRGIAFLMLPLFLIVPFLAVACASGSNKPSINQQRQQAVQQRANAYAKAVAQVPTPNVTNFPRRQTLADAVKRQSLSHHPWYVYVLGQNGTIVNYFVAKSVPVNDCDYLSSTQAIYGSTNGNIVLDSPSLEGVYQSGSGCNTLTFFDLSTDSEVQVTAIGSYITDRPLKVQAQPLKVQSVK